MPGTRYTRRTLIHELVLVLVAAVFCLPFYLLIALALATTSHATKTPLSFPWPPQWGNLSLAWSTGGQAGLGDAMLSSVVITASSVAALIVLGSLCAYVLARRNDRMGNVVYILFVLGMILPFQLAIIPLYVAMRHLGLVGNYTGMIVLNVGLLMPLTVFLYTGFMRALPRDYEEAALVDGAGVLATYGRIVFPLLWPVTATVAVFVGTIIWNEFFVALVFLSGSRYQTLPPAVLSFAGDYADHWNLIFAGIAIAVAPVILVYVFAQRWLLRGYASGIKG